jgi:hypothetical protein
MTDDIVVTQILRTRGFSTGDIARLSRIGELARVRRGAYAYARDSEQTAEQHHRRLILATAPHLVWASR